MSVILILLTASLTIAISFLIAFIWSVKNGQYEDDYTPSVRMLFDDNAVAPADNGATDAKDLDTAGPTSLLRVGKTEAAAEPEAARPGAQIRYIK